MNFQRSIEKTIARIIIGAVKAPTAVRRLFMAFGRKITSTWQPLVSQKGSERGDSADGSQGAGVPAPLKPRPPMLSAAAAKALPELGEEEVA
jgi:hypothetical protein